MDEAIELAKSIGLALGEIIITLYICIQYVKKNLKKPDVSKKIPEQNKIDLEIMSKMDYLKELLSADRIHIYEFHNGDHYSDYRSAYKFSCSYEAVRAGNIPVRNKCIGLPISVMPRFINRITTTGKFICNDIDCIRNDMPSTYAFKRELGVKAFYDVAIRNEQGLIIGFVAIQWDNETNPTMNEDEIKRVVWFLEDKIKESIKLSK